MIKDRRAWGGRARKIIALVEHLLTTTTITLYHLIHHRFLVRVTAMLLFLH